MTNRVAHAIEKAARSALETARDWFSEIDVQKVSFTFDVEKATPRSSRSEALIVALPTEGVHLNNPEMIERIVCFMCALHVWRRQSTTS